MDLFDRDESSWDTLIFYADEWKVFSDTRHNEATAIYLFNDIVNAAWDDDDGEPPVDAADYYRRRHTVSDEWDDFCEEVRLDSTTPFPLNEYMHEEFGRRLVMAPAGSTLFRARLGCVDEDGVSVPYRGADIGAPPITANSGRAHRAPERVLYVADEEATCVAEVRPARGMNISVCTMMPTRDLRIVDLSRKGAWPDPFFTEEPLYHMDMEARCSSPSANKWRFHCGVTMMKLTIFRASCWPTSCAPADTMASAIQARYGPGGRMLSSSIQRLLLLVSPSWPASGAFHWSTRRKFERRGGSAGNALTRDRDGHACE